MPSQSRHPKISVVIPARNESHYLRPTVEQFQATLPAASEIIVVDNGTTDGSSDFLLGAGAGARLLRTQPLGVAGARNWGAWHSRGEIIVFADGHVEIAPGWYSPLIAALAKPNVGAAGPVIVRMGAPEYKGYGYRLIGADLNTEWMGWQGATPYPVPCLCGCFLAVRRDTFVEVGGFDSGFVGWGTEDTEFSLRLWLLGYEQLLIPQVEVAHLFREKHPYEVNWVDVLYNNLRMAFTHFGARRVAQVVEAFKHQGHFAAAMAQTVESDIWEQRAKLTDLRCHSDDWFFTRFGMTW